MGAPSVCAAARDNGVIAGWLGGFCFCLPTFGFTGDFILQRFAGRVTLPSEDIGIVLFVLLNVDVVFVCFSLNFTILATSFAVPLLDVFLVSTHFYLFLD